MCRVAHPILDEFGSVLYCLHLCVSVGVVCMFFQQLVDLEDLLRSKAEFALDYGTIVVGWFPSVSVVFGALGVVLIIVVLVALPTTVGFLLVGSLIDFH